MRALAEGEVAIQIWSGQNPEGDRLEQLVQAVIERLDEHPELGLVIELEGPSPHIPDYFSELYGTVLGWLIYVADADPIKLKRLVMSLELDGLKRLADVDVFTSYFDKVSRCDLKLLA